MSPAQRIRRSMAHPGPACPRAPALTRVPWSHATPFGAWPGCAPDSPWQQDPTRWGLGTGDGSLGQSIGCAHPRVRACAEPRASPFSDLLAERGPSAKGFQLATSLPGGRPPHRLRAGTAQVRGSTVAWGDPCARPCLGPEAGRCFWG